jgi:hypothetical protein
LFLWTNGEGYCITISSLAIVIVLWFQLVAFRNRKLELPEKLEKAQERGVGLSSIEDFHRKDNLKYEA